MTTTYTVTYTVQKSDLVAGTVTNSVSLSVNYSTTYTNDNYSGTATADCEVTVLKFYPTGIVLDYGLPMTIDYTDYHGSYDLVSGTATYGEITVDKNTVTYTPATVLPGADTAAVYDTEGIEYTFKIYPATSVYYEEGFADYGTGWSVTSGGSWSDTDNTGTATQEAHSAQDPDTEYNNYGYDDAYADDTGASDGTAAGTATVGDSLSFTFTGTGVDIFANCDSDSGMVAIRIVDNNDSSSPIKKFLFVDMANSGDYAVSGTAYNTPIASVSGLAHGSYTVTIYLVTAGPGNGTDSGFQFDGFRVYDTIDNDTADTASDAYTVQTTVYQTDDEDYPVYYELRDYVLAGLNVATDSDATIYASDIAASTAAQVYATSTENTSGAVVYYDESSSGNNVLTSGTDVQNLLNDGPKNELYLYPGMTVIFKITTDRKVEIGLRSVTGASVSYTVTAVSSNTSGTAEITAGDLSSTVDMFYTLQTGADDGETVTYTITVPSSSSGVLSITDIKVCDCPDDTVIGELSEEDLTAALISIGYAADEEEEISAGVASLTAEASYGSTNAETETEETSTDTSLTGETAAETAADSTDSQTETETTEMETTGSTDTDTEAEETSARVASLEVNLSDHTGSVIATTTLAKNGAAGEETTFAASDILSAVNLILPDGYALVSADDITDRTAVYGESSSLTLQIGRVATLTVTCVKSGGQSGTSTVATVTLTKVQTGPNSRAIFTASEIRAAIPSDYRVLLVTSVRVNYGSGENTVVTVY